MSKNITLDESGRAIRCDGYHARRLEAEGNDQERVMAEKWRELNNRPWFENNGIPLVRSLRSEMPPNTRAPYHHTTVAEERIAATVFQWLGTNCGQAALRECGFYLRECGCEEE